MSPNRYFKTFIPVFDDQENIRAHVKEEMQSRKLALQSMKNEIAKQDLKCEKCSITFPTIEELSYHKMTQFYKEGTKYQCPDCSFNSCLYNGIKTHIENAHNNKEKVKNLKFEANETASGDILYTAKILCAFCKKSYINFDALKSHKENDIKAICPGCTFESCSDKIVIEHMKNVHESTQPRPMNLQVIFLQNT